MGKLPVGSSHLVSDWKKHDMVLSSLDSSFDLVRTTMVVVGSIKRWYYAAGPYLYTKLQQEDLLALHIIFLPQE